MWQASPCSLATAVTSRICAIGQTAPPPKLVVFSTSSRRERGAWRKAGELIAAAHLLGGEHAARALEPAHHDPGQRRRPAGFGVERMRARREDDLVALAAMHPRRDLVAHRAGRQIDRGLLAEQIGDPLAQAR